MKLRTVLLTVVSILSVLTSAKVGSVQHSTLYSCQSALQKYKFHCADNIWHCTCFYEPLAASVLECMDLYLPGSTDREKGHYIYLQACEKYTGARLSSSVVHERMMNASKLFLDASDTTWDHSESLFSPVRVTEEEVSRKIRDYRAFLGNYDVSQVYGIIINVYWFMVIAWFAFWNKIKRTHWNARLVSPKINYLRSHFSLPLLFGAHQQPLRITSYITTLVPTTAEGMSLLGYFIIHTAFLIRGYHITSDNEIFGNNSQLLQLVRYIADRSGLLSFGHFPILVLFAGRNNILIGLSELPYASFMSFHKWTARIMVVDAFIHTSCYLLAMWMRSTFRVFYKAWWFTMGVVAMTVGLVMLFFAIHLFRVKHYEWFLISHIIFAIVFFASCWEHCVTFGWLEWISLSMAVWVTDRIVRLYRLFKFGTPSAQIEFISDGTFKVNVTRPQNWSPYPGCFVYIHFLHWSIFWQSHPFTIVDSVLDNEQVTIYIKAKDGLTGKVMSLLSGRGMINLRVSLEGPYGNQSPCENYDDVLLFAGGNGIPGPFYHALNLTERMLLPKSRVHLIWVIRSMESVRWFERELQRLQRTQIRCDIYITRGFDPAMVDVEPLLCQFKHFIKFHSGRAPSKKILMGAFDECMGTMAIVTCGPGIMCDEIRSAVAVGVEKSTQRIDLFEELQVW